MSIVTIAPALLDQLSKTPSSAAGASLFGQASANFEVQPLVAFGNDEAAYRIAFTRRGQGEGERKLSQVRNLSCINTPRNQKLTLPGDQHFLRHADKTRSYINNLLSD
jgi:hypothetical protein